MIEVDRLGSGVRVSPVFQKKNSRLLGRLGSELRVVGRFGLGVRVSASFQNKIPRLVGRLGSGMRVSAIFSIFLLQQPGECPTGVGREIVREETVRGANVRGI